MMLWCLNTEVLISQAWLLEKDVLAYTDVLSYITPTQSNFSNFILFIHLEECWESTLPMASHSRPSCPLTHPDPPWQTFVSKHPLIKHATRVCRRLHHDAKMTNSWAQRIWFFCCFEKRKAVRMICVVFPIGTKSLFIFIPAKFQQHRIGHREEQRVSC